MGGDFEGKHRMFYMVENLFDPLIGMRADF